MREWGEDCWTLGEAGEGEAEEQEDTRRVMTLGERVARRVEQGGVRLDQLTINRLQDAVLPRRDVTTGRDTQGHNNVAVGQNIVTSSPWNDLPDDANPLDGLPFELTLSARAGPPGGEGSGIDWRETYKQLQHMTAIASLYSLRARLSAPGSGEKKTKAARDAIGCVMAGTDLAFLSVLT